MNVDNLKFNSSVEDYAEIHGIDCDGDDRETLIVFSYDIDEDCYRVEQFLDGSSQECESFSDREDASREYDRWVKQAEIHYVKEKRDFERGRVKATVAILYDVVADNGNDLDPHALNAINLLAEIIGRGHAANVSDDLDFLASTVYQVNRAV